MATPEPPTTVPFAHSAAGHQGISTSEDGSLLIKPCTKAEIAFYESAKDHPNFQAHMPTFMGKMNYSDDPTIQGLASTLESQGGVAPATAAQAADLLATSQNDGAAEKGAGWKPSGGAKLSTGLSIILSNATSGFVHPNIIDLKLGARLWDDDAPLEKRKKLDEVSNETTSGKLGFRVAGMRTYLGDAVDETPREVNAEVKDGYKVFNKFYGRQLPTERVADAFTAYLASAVRAGKGEFIAKRLLREIKSVQWVLENEESRMYSASILMVYEGDAKALEEAIEIEKKQSKTDEHQEQEAEEADAGGDEDDDDEEEQQHKIHDVCLIDFAHAHWCPGQGPDENALHGVRSVRKLLEDVVSSSQ